MLARIFNAEETELSDRASKYLHPTAQQLSLPPPLDEAVGEGAHTAQAEAAEIP
jgi:hypothetical protein